MTAIDLLLHAASDDKPKRFLHVSDDAMRPHLAAAREKSLKQTLESFGETRHRCWAVSHPGKS